MQVRLTGKIQASEVPRFWHGDALRSIKKNLNTSVEEEEAGGIEEPEVEGSEKEREGW